MARPSPRDIGLAFETHALRFLNSTLHTSLSHVGGAGDGGVDLRGFWWLPRSSGIAAPALNPKGVPYLRKITPHRLLAQCKAEKRVLGPRAVRELEGVMSHIYTGKRAPPSLAVLLSQSGFTPAAMDHAQRTPAPMLLLHLPGGRVGDEEADAEVAGAWWNAAFTSVLGPLGIEIRREVALRSGVASVGVWYDGGRMERFGPPPEL